MDHLFFRPFSPVDAALGLPFQLKIDLNFEVNTLVAPRPRMAAQRDAAKSKLSLVSLSESSEDDDAEQELQSILLATLQDDAFRQAENPIPYVAPSPDLSEHFMEAFSPPTRAVNPMILNSPFMGDREGAYNSEGVELGLFSVSPPPSVRNMMNASAERRRRLRSMSCPERGPMVVGEA